MSMADFSSKEAKWLSACVSAAPVFSTCSRRNYAAFVIAGNGRVVGFGYNGSPPGMRHCVDGACPRAFSDVAPGSRYDEGPGRCIAVHAEANALLYCDATDRQGATLYVNGPPCPDCAKLIAAAGISRVVHLAWEHTSVMVPVDNHLEEMGIEVVAIPREALSDYLGS